MDGHLDEQLVPPQSCILSDRVHARQHCTIALVHSIGTDTEVVHDTTIFEHNTGAGLYIAKTAGQLWCRQSWYSKDW